MYDIITFGSATQDIHLISKAFKVLEDPQNFDTGQGICLALGSKSNVESIYVLPGGGGANTAVTFAKQGLKTAFCGAIGSDMAGLEIIRVLRQYKIDSRLLCKKKEKRTNRSVIMSNGSLDRTILAYRGAADFLDKNDIPWKKIKKSRWFYLAPFTDLLCDNFEDIVNFAVENKIKIAINPSMQQLSLSEDKLKRIFQKVEIIFLNKEEASFLTKINSANEKEVLQKIKQMGVKIAVVTKGAEGVVVFDGEKFYSALAHTDKKIIDTTGAGDSFASGFLTDYIRTKGNIEKSIQLGIANGEANLTEIGAQTGLLDKKSKFECVSVIKS